MKSIFLILITLFTQSIMAQKTDSSKEEKANLKFVGEYYTGRDPCQYLPNGSRRWRMITGFKVKKVIIGNIQVKHIEINPSYNNGGNGNTGVSLVVGKNYTISLALDKEKTEILKNKNTHFTHLNLITNEEIVEIIETKENLNCLTNKSFNLVLERIMLQPSKTILKYDNEEWEILIAEKKDIIFRKNNSLIGKIASDLNIYSVLKTFNAHEKSKKDINNIFCKIYDWLQNGNNIKGFYIIPK